ncbi:acyl-CoA thioesterase [Acidobacteriota bacterium]
MSDATKHLCSDPVTTGARVRYADTDRMGVAYYATYLVWFEIGRAEFMRELGYTYKRCEEDGLILPVIKAEVQYHRPARYDDELRISTWLSDMGRVKVQFYYEITNGADDTLVASGSTEHAALAPSGKPIRIPDPVRKILTRGV